MRALPGMTVVAPGDPVEAKAATRAITEHSGPCHLRLGKAGEPIVHQSEIQFELGKAIRMREGRDATLIRTGASCKPAFEPRSVLRKKASKRDCSVCTP